MTYTFNIEYIFHIKSTCIYDVEHGYNNSYMNNIHKLNAQGNEDKGRLDASGKWN